MKTKIFLTSILALSLALPAYAEGEGVVTSYNPSTGVYTPPAPTCDSGTLGVTSGTVDLEAMWEANTYTVIFDKNDNDATGSIARSPLECTYDQACDITNTETGFEKAGSVFMGWNTASNGSGTAISDTLTAPQNLSSTDGDTVTLYAQWQGCALVDSNGQPAVNNSEYNIDSVTVSTANNTCTFTVTCDSGFTNNGNSTFTISGTANTPDKVITAAQACSSGNVINLTYDLGNGSSTATNTGDGGAARSCTYGGSVTLPDAAPTKTGYKFKGWKVKTPANNNQGD